MNIDPSKLSLSPNIKQADLSSPPTLEDKVKVFEDRVIGWQLYPAATLINGDQTICHPALAHSGYATLSIVMSYYEMIARFTEGDTSTSVAGEFFRKGVRIVHPRVDSLLGPKADSFLDRFYKDTRCGMYHAGMTRSGVLLTRDFNFALGFHEQSESLVINPHILPVWIQQHFEGYIKRLRDPSEQALRENFERCYNAH